MRKKLKRSILAILTAAMTFGLSMTAYAAPRNMPDGQLFDAELYAQLYPDVVAVLGTDETALYNHYVNNGKAEGRIPYNLNDLNIRLQFWSDYEVLDNNIILQQPLQLQFLVPDGLNVTQQELRANLTDDSIIAMAQQVLPTGTQWGDETWYDTVSDVSGRNIAKRGAGCQAFAYWLTDALYGDIPMVRYENTETENILTNGTFMLYRFDIVHYLTPQGTLHCGVVLGADMEAGLIYTAEGNVNGMINWDRAISLDGSDGCHIFRIYRRETVGM